MLEPVAIMFSSQPSENRLQPCKSCIAQGYHIGCMELERAVFGLVNASIRCLQMASRLQTRVKKCGAGASGKPQQPYTQDMICVPQSLQTQRLLRRCSTLTSAPCPRFDSYLPHTRRTYRHTTRDLTLSMYRLLGLTDTDNMMATRTLLALGSKPARPRHRPP